MSISVRVNQQDLKAYWGWFFAWGIVMFGLGVAAISASTLTTLISVIFIGFLILLGGMILLVDSFTFWWGKWSGFFLHLIMGLLYFGVGLALVNHPVLASASLTLLLGIFYILVGVTRIIYSLSVRVLRWQWSFVSGLISLLLGILITSNLAVSSLFVIGLFVGIDLLFTGAAYIISATYARSLSRRGSA